MSPLAKLTTVEAKLFVREPLAMFWGLIFPAVLLLVIGLFFPGADTPSPDLGGRRLIDLYAPIALGLALATLAFTTLPVTLSTYRERGVLRRLATTPVSPWRLVVAQLIIQVVVAVLAATLAIGVGVMVLDIAIPQNLPGFAVVYLLAAVSMLALGLVIGALAPTVSSGQGIGMAVYFPMLFFAGVYFPRQVMPDGLRTVSDMTPTGAGVQALQDTWVGLAPRLLVSWSWERSRWVPACWRRRRSAGNERRTRHHRIRDLALHLGARLRQGRGMDAVCHPGDRSSPQPAGSGDLDRSADLGRPGERSRRLDPVHVHPAAGKT